MKNIYLLLVVMAICNTLSGQVSVGLSVGNNFSKFKSQSDVRRNPNSNNPSGSVENPLKNGLMVGIPLEINVSNNFSLFTMLSFMQKGHKSSSIQHYTSSYQPINGTTAISEHTYRSNHIEVPLQVKYYLTKNNIRTYVMLGPSLGYLIGVKSNLLFSLVNEMNNTAYYGQHDSELSLGEFKNSMVNRLDISLTMGGGIEYTLGTGKIFFNATYMHGFANNKLSPQGNMPYKLSNSGLLTSVGFLLPLFK